MKTIKVTIPIAVMFLIACGALAAPVATNTPFPLPNEISTLPVATLESSPVIENLNFRDDFDGAIGDGWQWIHENNTNWSLTNAPGWLEIKVGGGHLGKGDIDNLLQRQAPEGNFELETKLKFTPTADFQAAGLFVYESDANHIQFIRAYCSSPICVGDGYYLDAVTAGNFTPENFATSVPATDTVYLRLRREGINFTAYASEDGVQWMMIGTHNIGIKPLFVGLMAGQAVNAVPTPAQFDYFAITVLP